MAYIGVSPFNGVRRKHTYTATSNQTSFSGAGTEGATLSYTDSNFVDVYQNGVKLGEADYTSTSGTAIVLAQGASTDDLVEIIVFDIFSISDTVSKSAGGTFDGNVTAAGTLAVTGNTTVGGTLGVTGVVTANAGVVVDNITIDGTQIDLSSGDLTIDVAGDIILDAAGNEIKFQDNGTLIGFITLDNTDLTIQSSAQDRDIIFKGDDGGSGIEAMRIDMSAGGNLCVGAAASIGAGKLEATFNGSSFNGIVLKTTRSATGTNFIEFTNAAGDNAGRINHDGTTTVAFTTSSDYRLKENVSYSWDATTRLKQLKPARFNFISQADKTVDGFLAHEVSNIVPAAIIGTKDEIKKWNADEIEDGLAPDGASDGDNKLDADGNAIPLMQGIDQSKLVPLLVKTIQELEARITALENA